MIPYYFIYSYALPAHALLQAGIAGVADNDVVEQFDVEQFSGGYQLIGDVDIFGGGGRVAARVVVADDNVGAVAHDGRAEDFGNAQHGTIDRAFIAFNRIFTPAITSPGPVLRSN